MTHVAPVGKMKRKDERSARLDASLRRRAARMVPPLLAWFASNARDLPWRRTQDPYAIWISEIMLQQTQVNTVIPYYERWMDALPTVRTLARASSHRLHTLWEGLGYYSRVHHLQTAAQVICSRHRGRFPDRFDDVLALPGIGRYTAGAVCSIAFNQPTPILDGNVIRVLTRVFGIDGDPKASDTNALLWALAGHLVRRAAGLDGQGELPVASHESARSGRRGCGGQRLLAIDHVHPPLPCSALNQALMELGATRCSPRDPDCPHCPIRRGCVARREGLTDRLPSPAKRPRITRVRRRVFVILQDRRVWMVRRPSKNGHDGLWEFPSAEPRNPREPAPITAERILPFPCVELIPWTTLQHSVTRYRITLEAFTSRVRGATEPGRADGRWLSLGQLQRFPLPSAHRRLARKLLEAHGSAPNAEGNPASGGARFGPGRRSIRNDPSGLAGSESPCRVVSIRATNPS